MSESLLPSPHGSLTHSPLRGLAASFAAASLLLGGVLPSCCTMAIAEGAAAVCTEVARLHAARAAVMTRVDAMCLRFMIRGVSSLLVVFRTNERLHQVMRDAELGVGGVAATVPAGVEHVSDV